MQNKAFVLCALLLYFIESKKVKSSLIELSKLFIFFIIKLFLFFKFGKSSRIEKGPLFLKKIFFYIN